MSNLSDDTAMYDDTLPLQRARAGWRDDLGWPPNAIWMTIFYIHGTAILVPRWSRRGGEGL